MVIGSEPCEPWDFISCCELPVGSEAVSGTMLQAASAVLWSLSGRQYGLCTVTLRPCRRECSGDVSEFFWNSWGDGGRYPRPVFFNGQWLNIVCGGCGSGCSCTVLSEAILPAPVHDITEVKLNGSVVVTGSYRLDNNRILVRTDGGTWPYCQDIAAADTEDNTWSVTARFGIDVPTLGKIAVGELMCELTKACVGDDSCILPAPVQSLSRQGVDMTFLDPSQVFADGKTGLYQSDLFIQSVNPTGLKSRSRVYDVDRPEVRRLT